MPSPSTQKVTGFFCSSRMAFSSGSKPGSGRSSRSSRVPSSERRARKRMIKSGLARWRSTGISWLSAMVSSRNAPWWSSGPSASIQAVRPMKAGHRPSPSSPWLPEKGFAPVTARTSSSSGRKSCPSVRSAWGISAASCRSFALCSALLCHCCSSGISPPFFFQNPNIDRRSSLRGLTSQWSRSRPRPAPSRPACPPAPRRPGPPASPSAGRCGPRAGRYIPIPRSYRGQP